MCICEEKQTNNADSESFCVVQVCQELNSTWAWELEQKGYQEMSMECKSSILKVRLHTKESENYCIHVDRPPLCPAVSLRVSV